MSDSDPCRLCGAKTQRLFSLVVLESHQIAYLECAGCGSLQTESPYWLKEAYEHNLAVLDTGAAQRNLANQAASFAIARLLGLRDVLDFGGGDGLLCRLLRDCGVNCYVNDKYAPPSYAIAYTRPDFARPSLLLAFEVFEHFANPSSELKDVFESGAEAILASTVAYDGEGSDWWYLTPESGQHVFFYSRSAMGSIARTYGYELVTQGNYWLFARRERFGATTRLVARLLLTGAMRRIVGATLRLMPSPGVTRDFDSLRSHSK